MKIWNGWENINIHPILPLPRRNIRIEPTLVLLLNLGSTSVLELLFPFLQHNSKRRAEDNTTMKKVGSNSTLSTFMSSEVDTIDDVTNRSIIVKRMVSQTSSCGDYISDNSCLPSPKKARRGSSVGSYSDASTVSSSPSSPPIKRILFQAEDEVLHTNACSPVVMMKRHYHHNREASSGLGWYLDEEDFNLYQHYFKWLTFPALLEGRDTSLSINGRLLRLNIRE